MLDDEQDSETDGDVAHFDGSASTASGHGWARHLRGAPVRLMCRGAAPTRSPDPANQPQVRQWADRLLPPLLPATASQPV